jgi:hypothetical protein
MDVTGTGNLREELPPELGRQLFRIVQTREAAMFEKNNRGGNDGTRERSTAGFIDAGNK